MLENTEGAIKNGQYRETGKKKKIQHNVYKQCMVTQHP
jgi:hypothetical protein